LASLLIGKVEWSGPQKCIKAARRAQQKHKAAVHALGVAWPAAALPISQLRGANELNEAELATGNVVRES